MVIQKDKTSKKFTLEDVIYCLELWVNLFSIATVMKNDFEIHENLNGIKIKMGTSCIHFNRKVENKANTLCGIKTIPQSNNLSYIGLNKTMDVNNFMGSWDM